MPMDYYPGANEEQLSNSGDLETAPKPTAEELKKEGRIAISDLVKQSSLPYSKWKTYLDFILSNNLFDLGAVKYADNEPFLTDALKDALTRCFAEPPSSWMPESHIVQGNPKKTRLFPIFKKLLPVKEFRAGAVGATGYQLNKPRLYYSHELIEKFNEWSKEQK
ncbi:MAG: hypothetical protein P4L74_05050 [Candidatus Doudnabacteria bacterium]|nr:hypothetical protein [Candidatus Doudnabacteria bacterium]